MRSLGQNQKGGHMTLDELVQNLNKWRKNKKSQNERIPKELWSEAVKLSKAHSLSEVVTKTELNRADLKRRLGIPPQKSQKEITFKKLEPAIVQNKAPIFELTTPAGTNIKVYQ
jgi:hypothetical protein